MLLFLFENNTVLSYSDIHLFSPLKPKVAYRKNIPGLSLLDQSFNVIQILLAINNIA